MALTSEPRAALGLIGMVLLSCAADHAPESMWFGDSASSGVAGSSGAGAGAGGTAVTTIDAAVTAPIDAAVIAPIDASPSDAQRLPAPVDVGVGAADAGPHAPDAAPLPRAMRPIWFDVSETIEIQWFRYEEGGYRLRLHRDRLTEEQERLLYALELVEGSSSCPENVAKAYIDVTLEFGAVNRYASFEGDCDDGSLVEYERLEALLATAACLPSKVPPKDTLARAPRIAVGDGCFHGLFNAYLQLPEWWLLVDVEEPGRYRFALHGCSSGELLFELVDSDGTSILASARGAGEVCPTIEHEFDRPGTYPLHVDMLSGLDTAGDLFLTADRTAP